MLVHATFDRSVSKDHLSEAMLLILVPIAFKPIAIFAPLHLAIALLQVVHEASSVRVARFPLENPLSLLLVIDIRADITIRLGVSVVFAPFTFAVLLVVPEFTLVLRIVAPPKKTLTVLEPICEHTTVLISILECLGASSVLLALQELPLVFRAIWVAVRSFTIRLIVSPLTCVSVILSSTPDPVSVFETLRVLTIVCLPIWPPKQALSIHQVITVLP